MTNEELRKKAEACAKSCRSKDRICAFLLPGSGVAYDDCPMRPHKCWHVSAKMWEQALRDVYQLYGHIKEEDMLMPTEENDGEFWWLQEVQTGKRHVVQIWADELSQKTHGSPVFFWAGNEVEEPVNRPDITWLGKVEAPKREADA